MINKILKALESCGIEEYRITDSTLESAELFFVKKALDTRRIENVHTAQVVIYNRFEKNGTAFLGSSDVTIEPSMTEAEIETELKKTYAAAAFVPNKPYKFPAPEKSDCIEMKSSLAEVSMQEACAKLTAALYKNDNGGEAFINSAEIFVYKNSAHIVSSYGTDVSFVKYSTKGEFVCQCKEPEDVETYLDFSYDDLECDLLSEKVAEGLKMTKDRAVARENAFTGNADIVLSGKYAAEVLSFYPSKANATMIYMQMSDFSEGCFVQGEQSEITGDIISMDYLPTAPYSEEGVKMVERKAVDKGTLKCIMANARYADYLKLPVTGNYSKIGFSVGEMSFEDMKKTPGFYVVNFSDFQMDDITGHFRGEIRLAYYNDGTTVTPVTGGSVNGSIFEAQKSLRLSKERQETTSFSGPKGILLKNVAVAGVEK